MSSSHPELKFTYRDYLLLPEDKRYELIEGDFYMVPAPRTFHQLVSGQIEFLLRQFIHERELGKLLHAPCDVYLSEHDVVQPDILFVALDRLGIIKDPYVQGPPDLVVEILSPSSVEKDRDLKKRLYSRFAVREYWIVDPDGRSVEVYQRREAELVHSQSYIGRDRLASAVLEGLDVEVHRFFEV